jgi:hypothetical protein
VRVAGERVENESSAVEEDPPVGRAADGDRRPGSVHARHCGRGEDEEHGGQHGGDA